MANKSKHISCNYRSPCPITRTLDLIGDKWTLLIVRDMCFFKKEIFSEFQNSSEKISTNILSDRLKKLEEFGIIFKSTYQENPIRYRYTLTKKGMALKPMIAKMISWGGHYCKDI